MSHPSFTGIRELDQEILLDLDDKSLARACQLDQWTRSVCINPLFWRARTLKIYGLEVLKHKPREESYQQQYQRLRRIQSIGDEYYFSIESPQIDEMIALMQKGILIHPRTMDYVARYGNVGTLNWLFDQGFRPTISTLRSAVFADRVENFEWVHQHGVQFDRNVADGAAMNGSVKILEHLFQNYNLLPRNVDLERLIAGGDSETLIWLDRHGLGRPGREDANLVRTIIDYIENETPLNPNIEDLVTAYVYTQPLTASIKSRIGQSARKYMDWVRVKRYLTREEIDQVKRRYQNLLNWMISIGIH